MVLSPNTRGCEVFLSLLRGEEILFAEFSVARPERIHYLYKVTSVDMEKRSTCTPQRGMQFRRESLEELSKFELAAGASLGVGVLLIGSLAAFPAF